MDKAGFTELYVDDAGLDWLRALGYACLTDAAAGSSAPGVERSDPGCRNVTLERQRRDSILPKLISGKLRMNDAGRFVARAP